MEKKIQQLIERFPKLTHLFHDPRIEALSDSKKQYIIDMVEDAIFWLDLDKSEHPNDGFRFMAATFGLERAQQQAAEQGLTGKEREEFLQPHQELFTQYNPYSGRSSDR